MIWLCLALAFAAAYALIGFVVAAGLNGLTASGGDRVQPDAVRAGLLWPLFLWRLLH